MCKLSHNVFLCHINLKPVHLKIISRNQHRVWVLKYLTFEIVKQVDIIESSITFCLGCQHVRTEA